MTQRTINLYDELQLLYYMDSDYFNGGTNEISDMSGNERHAQAIGGPTFGQSGPDNFEAVSFDGSDDYFESPNSTSVEQGKGVTMAILYKATGDSGDRMRFAYAGNRIGLVGGNNRRGSIDFGFDDSSAIPRTLNGTDNPIGESLLTVARVIPSDGVLSIRTFNRSGKVIGRLFNDSWDGTYTDTGTGYTRIGHASTFGSSLATNETAFACAWGRVLNSAEVQYLNRLTAPRQQLL